MKKILVFDIETAPIMAYVWGTRDENIGLNQIHQDWSVIAWGAKWLGDAPSKVIYRDQRSAKRLENDREILKPLWKLLDEADIVVTQNGKRFDSPRLNARFIVHGMPPPSPYKHLDTYQIAKSAMAFTSNKLAYLTETLCVKYKKLAHNKFPGFELWKECLAGNNAAWDEMKRYNIHDVLATEELYLKLRAWAPQNAEAVSEDRGACKACGRTDRLVKGGTESTLATLWVRLHCLACGKWQRGDKIKVKEIKCVRKG